MLSLFSGIAEIATALSTGAVSSVELVNACLDRIEMLDRAGPRLNSVAVVSPDALTEARRADELRRAGQVRGPLHGVPFTVKDNIKVAGQTVAAGSPAFAGLIADGDAFAVELLRTAGAVLVGRTNMPPLAAGGLQRGHYGRSESPYNPAYLSAAWGSGSSHGAAVATAAGFACFALGTETTSSGRSPASNNALVAYTPSRGLLSLRGVWPLYPIRDVLVPLTRSVEDLLVVLDVLAVDDPLATGDLWRTQRAVALPAVDEVRPARYGELRDPDALRGRRLGVPTMFVGRDPSGRAAFGVRPSVSRLWDAAASALRDIGATVVEVDFAPQHDYEQDRPGAQGPVERGLLPPEWWRPVNFATGAIGTSREYSELNPFAWEQFLRENGQPGLTSWGDVNPAQVFPHPPGSVDARRLGPHRPYAAHRDAILAGFVAPDELPGLADALVGIERFRAVAFESWLAEQDLDAVVFPANVDVAAANADVDERAYDHAMSNGVLFSNTNLMLRHLGIPSVSVPMGVMGDTQMPVNLTFATAAYRDADVLAYAYAYERATQHRRPPPLPIDGAR